MMAIRRRASAARLAAAKLYDEAVAWSRTPALYAAMGAPDTVEGRFEMLTTSVILLLEWMKGSGAGGEAARQSLFDLYLANLDGALREMGVGDLVVGKRMKALGRIFYGRARAYDAAFAALPGRGALEDLIARTILAEAPGPASALADGVLRRRNALADRTIDDVARGAAGVLAA